MTITRNELKHVKSLLNRKGRLRCGQFTAEGVRLLEETLNYNVLPQSVYVAMATISERAKQLVGQLKTRGVRIVPVRQRELTAMADTGTPQGLVAVFDRPTTSLGQLYHEGIRKIVWCPDIADPGNLGTIVRTALAFGIELLIVGEGAVDPYSPKAIRSSVGAVLGLPVAVADTDGVVDIARRASLDVIVADSRAAGATPIENLASGGFILALGSEAHGVDARIQQAATIRVRIPHDQRVESLNVAIAGAILMQRLYR